MFKFNNYLIKRYSTSAWKLPRGQYTNIKVYNCVTRNKEPLILKNENVVTWYTCGPTVYDSAHIGHASCYVKLDIIQRILKNYFNFNLVTVMNITDIDDKIIKKSQETKINHKTLSKNLENEFWCDLESLNIPKPDITLKVTENIDLIVDFIKNLEDSGCAYKSSDNSVYFNVQNGCKVYGKLQNIGDSQSGNEKTHIKKSPMDFALWKCSKQGEPYWNSPWGPGRPGWHIECSALASYALGSNIDIHAGGIDLRFPHHENEEAQSCAFHGNDQWVNYWLHTGHLHLKNAEKMSKSLKNTVSIQDMLNDANSDSFRMACAMSHYRNNMEYSSELLQTANNNLKTYKNFLSSCDDFKNGFIKASINSDVLNTQYVECINEIREGFCDDFDTPRVISALNKLVSTVNSMLSSSGSVRNVFNGEMNRVVSVSNLVLNTLNTLGLFNKNKHADKESQDLNEIVDILNNFRQDVRILGIEKKEKQLLTLCDRVRDDLGKKSIVVKDLGKVSTWSR